MANVDRIIMETGYGCEASLVSGDTMLPFTSMYERGQPDAVPEIWVKAERAPLANPIGACGWRFSWLVDIPEAVGRPTGVGETIKTRRGRGVVPISRHMTWCRVRLVNCRDERDGTIDGTGLGG